MTSRRAANGMGSITQHKLGHWEGKISYVKPDGSHGRKTVTAKTSNECKEKVLALLAAQQKGKPIAVKEQTLADYLTDWLEVSIKPRRAPSTYKNYKQMIHLYITPTLGRVKLSKLTGQHIERWENELRQKNVARTGVPMSARTVQLCHGVLRTALNRAVKLRLLPDNPCLTIDAPTSRRPEIRPLDLEQARLLLSAVQGTRLETLWSVAIACGVRPGEALGLRWQDVNWDRGTIAVRQQLQTNHEGKLVLCDLKTDRARRIIHLPAVTLQALRQHQDRQRFEQERAQKWEDHDLIFCTEGRKGGMVGGRPLIHRNVYRLLQTTLQAAGLPHQRLYDLRHLCASLLLAQGASMREIMEILGHSQMSITSDTYTHIYNEQGRANAERMNRLLMLHEDLV